jgi:hypothetical protein
MVSMTARFGARYYFARLFPPRPEWLSRLNAERAIRLRNHKQDSATMPASRVDVFRAPFVGSFPMICDDPLECPADYMPGNCFCRPIPQYVHHLLDVKLVDGKNYSGNNDYVKMRISPFALEFTHHPKAPNRLRASVLRPHTVAANASSAVVEDSVTTDELFKWLALAGDALVESLFASGNSTRAVLGSVSEPTIAAPKGSAEPNDRGPTKLDAFRPSEPVDAPSAFDGAVVTDAEFAPVPRFRQRQHELDAHLRRSASASTAPRTRRASSGNVLSRGSRRNCHSPADAATRPSFSSLWQRRSPISS